MNRRARRQRPATAAEQQLLRRFVEAAGEVLADPAGPRPGAVAAMRRLADAIRGPAGTAAGQLADTIGRRLDPTDPPIEEEQ